MGLGWHLPNPFGQEGANFQPPTTLGWLVQITLRQPSTRAVALVVIVDDFFSCHGLSACVAIVNAPFVLHLAPFMKKYEQ